MTVSADPSVASQHTARRPTNFIGGKALPAGATLGVAIDPASSEELGETPSSTRAEVEQALTVAFEAWGNGTGPFSGASSSERQAGLERFASALESQPDEFAYWHAREVGIPITTTRQHAFALGDLVRGIAAVAPRVLEPRLLSAGERRVEILRLPWGPAALYTAWNAPSFLAVTKIAYALAAGCPAILKPSEHAGATTGLLVDALQAAELDPGWVQVLCGGADVGSQLANDPRVRMISYTGGTTGGRAVAEAAAARMAATHLELSASNPTIVTRDADLDLAAVELARGSLVLNGQWCEAPRRVYVHASTHDELVSRLLDELSPRVIGDPTSDSTELGPLAYSAQFKSVTDSITRLATLGHVERATQRLPSAGYFMAPTLIVGLPLSAVDREIFGPVLAISPYNELAEALEAANGLNDGLAAYVFSGDRDEAFSIGTHLHAGEVRIGGTRVLDLAEGSSQSFWGTSGIGGHGLIDVLQAHTGIRIVGEEDYTLAI